VPHSSHLALTQMIDHVVRMAPRRVLDIGLGYGKWGFLVREALDFIPGRLYRDDWQVRIDGIDAHPYVSPLHDWVYDDVRVADALDVLDELDGYDLVVLGDVIEHFDKEVGLSLLRSLAARNRNLLVTTPVHFFEQEMPENPFERHRSHWSPADFREWTVDYDVVGGAALVVAIAGRGASYPTRAHDRASRIAHGLPGLARRGAAPRVVKALLRRIL
jgi:SAM-dependent methyltransferase